MLKIYIGTTTMFSVLTVSIKHLKGTPSSEPESLNLGICPTDIFTHVFKHIHVYHHSTYFNRKGEKRFKNPWIKKLIKFTLGYYKK